MLSHFGVWPLGPWLLQSTTAPVLNPFIALTIAPVLSYPSRGNKLLWPSATWSSAAISNPGTRPSRWLTNQSVSRHLSAFGALPPRSLAALVYGRSDLLPLRHFPDLASLSLSCLLLVCSLVCVYVCVCVCAEPLSNPQVQQYLGARLLDACVVRHSAPSGARLFSRSAARQSAAISQSWHSAFWSTAAPLFGRTAAPNLDRSPRPLRSSPRLRRSSPPLVQSSAASDPDRPCR
jgi:hypothetical protein